MNQICMFTRNFSLDMKTGPDIRDITPEIKGFIRDSNITTGIIHVFVPGSTGSVTAIEYEPGVISDLKRAITALAPPDRVYDHEQAWHDGNGHSHVQAALLGPSMSIPVREAAPRLGTWQQVVVVNHDNGSRIRKVELTLTGI
ncbi:secondary thiamine-phosphate synthase enzyme YjbQ [Desulfospira joergensenii]|uniref:secondary thiamine-phosphate synthase enzyme YjbQ n=1 Tax=Desulfospira joergensenii TaxID=53329 RepID=UPI0003B59593|nr:secondary thiamine-phosphate synthase enzyme YjbQ [Desulfospira joergensenii]